MWDFSWLERRWPGAGYEDWNQALDELCERGYNAVRIDPYPQLIRHDPEKEYLLKTQWNQQNWGACADCRVRVVPALLKFIKLCKERHIQVALSGWFRKDVDEVRRFLSSPQALADAWVKTLQLIEAEGLLDSILFVDLCNEWPVWAPYYNYHESVSSNDWASERSRNWMEGAITEFKSAYPNVDATFSPVGVPDIKVGDESAYDFLDLHEPHIWMVQCNDEEFHKRIGYYYKMFGPEEFELLAKYAQPLYESNQHYWNSLLMDRIKAAADLSRRTRKPLVTTECWAIVDWKDWPMLDWQWVKDLNALGTRAAISEKRWKAIATSNFCGPQFVGMWRDVDWHQQLTREIRSAELEPDLQG